MKITENLGEFQKIIDIDTKTGMCLEDTINSLELATSSLNLNRLMKVITVESAIARITAISLHVLPSDNN